LRSWCGRRLTLTLNLPRPVCVACWDRRASCYRTGTWCAGSGAGGSGVQVAARAGGDLGQEPGTDPDRTLVDHQVRSVQVVGAPTRGAHAEAGHRPDGGGQVPAEVLPAEGLLGEHERVRAEHGPG